MTTRFGTVCPAEKFKLDTTAGVAPVGNTGGELGAEALVTVTLSTTPDTPDDGTPPWPVSWTSIEARAPSRADAAPTPLRVSSTRSGGSGLKKPSTPGVAAAGVA